MADHPLQVAADRFVLKMADVVLDAVGAAREAVDLGRLESALARRDVDGAVFALEAAVDAAERVLTGATKPKAAEDTDPERGLEAVIAETVAAGGNAVDLCVLVAKPDQAPPEVARSTRYVGDVPESVREQVVSLVATEVNRLQRTYGALRGLSINELVFVGDEFLPGGKGGSIGRFSSATGNLGLAVKRPIESGPLSVGGASWHVDGSFNGTVRHELGHAVHATLRRDSWSAQMEWDDLASRLIDADKNKRTVTVSRYSVTNGNEYFAECWSAFTHPSYKPGALPKAVEQFFAKHLTE